MFKKGVIYYTFFQFSPLFEEEIIDIEQYNKDIEEAEKEIDAGNYYTHEQVLAEIKTWKSRAV